jgi:hypothetical protein
MLREVRGGLLTDTAVLLEIEAGVVLGCAALVPVLAGVEVVAARGHDRGGLALVVDVAGTVNLGVVGVQGRGVLLEVIPTLDDVDLADLGPRVAVRPAMLTCQSTSLSSPPNPVPISNLQGRPGAADGLRMMGEASDEESMVVRLLTLDPHAVTALALGVQLGLVVDLHEDLVAGRADELERLGIGPSAVLDEAVGGIDVLQNPRVVPALEEVELVEEVGVVVRLVKVPSLRRDLAHGRQGEHPDLEERRSHSESGRAVDIKE